MAKAPIDVFPEGSTPEELALLDLLEAQIDEAIATGGCAKHIKSVEICLDEVNGSPNLLTQPLREALCARYLAAGWRSAFIEFIGNRGRIVLQAP